MKTTIAISLVFSAILIYGYWHVSSHGSLYISVMDLSDPKHARPIPEAELWFLDSANHVLAQAKADNSSGVISISQPASYACQEFEHLPFSPKTTEQWRLCFKKQSRWLMTWIKQVKSAHLKSNTCWLPEIPISVSSHTDSWWFWWVPLRHIGGKPYSHFSITIMINHNHCRVDSHIY